jgi:hypothetical protein
MIRIRGETRRAEMSKNDHTPTNPPERQVKRRRWGWLWWSLIFVGVLIAAAGGVIYAHADRPIKAPVWLHEKVEARLSDALPGSDIRFGDISLLIPRGGRPKIQLRDAEITSEDGRPVLSLANLEARVAFAPLLQGDLLLGKLVLSGATVNVRRRADGTFDLSFGVDPSREAASVAELIASLDALLLTPELTALTRVEAEALTLRYEDARAGRAWTVDGARFVMERDAADLRIRGDLALLGGYDYASTVELNYESQIGELAANFGMAFQDMASRDIGGQVGALAWLDAVRAPISGALRVGVDEQGQLGRLSGTLQIGQGVVQPNDQTRPIPFDSARTYLTFDPETQTILFDELSVQSPQFSGSAAGKALLRGPEQGWPTQLQGQFSLTAARANPNQLFPQPVSLDQADMTFRLDLDPFEFTLGEMSLSKDGHVLVLDGKMRADETGWNLALNGQVADLKEKTVLGFWPETLKPKTRLWVSENIHALTLTNTQIALRAQQGRKPTVYISTEFKDGDIRFMKHMPNIKNAAGRAELMGSRFVVTADQGTVTAPEGGQIDATGTSLIVDDVRIKGPPAEVRLKTDSTITAALSLLDSKPLFVMTKAERPVALADGRAQATGSIFLRLKKKLPRSEVHFDIDAKLQNVRSSKLIPKKVFAASDLDVSATNERIVVSGRGRVGQVGFQGHWVSPIKDNPQKVSRVEGTLSLSRAFLDEFNVTLPPGTVSGEGPARFVIDLEKGKEPRFTGTSTLSGVGLRIPELGWSLPKARTGKLEVAGTLGTLPSIESLTLEAHGLNAEGAVSLRAGGGLDQARFSRVQAGNWLDAPITLRGRGAGVAPAVDIAGGRLDLRRMGKLGGAGGGSGKSSVVPINVRLDRLRITDSLSLTGVRGEFQAHGGGMTGRFVGAVNGKAAVAGQMVPQNGRSAFTITSNEAGAALAAAGLLSKADKGDLTLKLSPVGDQSYDGELNIRSVWLKDAPAVANLLNAASIVGLLEQMGGGGIHFGEVEANFRITPSQVIVTKSSAVGSSIGISMDGIYDLKNKMMDMQGVFSPIYAVNAIGSVLTRKGEGLLGFNFTMKGSGDNPKVGINPLSIFTPGMFREIFRRPPPKLTE